MGRERFEAEFGCYTDWLVEAIEELAIDDPVPAACRGTGNPHLLDHLAGELTIKGASTFIDVGAGLGGPAAWIASTRGCRVVGIDVMESGARGMRRLFPEVLATVATSRALPFRDDAFDVGWSLGVIEMIQDKPAALRELNRVLAPGARFAVFDFLATDRDVSGAPLADRFEQVDDVMAAIENAGLKIAGAGRSAELDPPPLEWRATTESVKDAVRRKHEGDDRLALVDEQLGYFNELRRSEKIEPWEFVLEAT